MGDLWTVLIRLQTGLVDGLSTIVEGVINRIWILPALLVFVFAAYKSWETRHRRHTADRAASMPQQRRRR